jgi:hypothetical protein
MIPAAIALNPFALMMEPALVQATMDGSSQLHELRHCEYHPLDQPARRNGCELQAFDDAIEAACAAGELDDDPADALIDAILGTEPVPLAH